MERKHWIGYAATAVVALGIGGVAAGADSSTDSNAKTVTETSTVTTASKPVEKVRTKTRTKTVTVTAAAPSTQVAEPEPAAVETPKSSSRTFSGNGGKKLPPFTVDEGSTIRWTNDGDLFQTFSDDMSIAINSQAHKGSTYVEAGTYTLDVNAIGTWKIKITPGS